MSLKIERVDHLVLSCTDVEATAAWYQRVLGMTKQVYGREQRIALFFGNQKINVRPTGDENWVTSKVDTPGALDLCFVTTSSPVETIAHFEACGVKVVEGPTTRSGALGSFVSVYCHDPEGNLIEVSSYPEASN